MKVKADHFEAIKSAIAEFDRKSVAKGENSLCKHAAEYREVYKYTPRRFRWDYWWAASREAGLCVGHSDNDVNLPIYDYANDDHIDTALRTAMRELGAPEWTFQK